jgi:hypothetical protein
MTKKSANSEFFEELRQRENVRLLRLAHKNGGGTGRLGYDRNPPVEHDAQVSVCEGSTPRCSVGGA